MAKYFSNNKNVTLIQKNTKKFKLLVPVLIMIIMLETFFLFKN